MESPYEVLGIGRGADADDVKAAYRERVKDAHPDHGGSHEEFRRVRDAYEAIKAGDATPQMVESTESRPAPSGTGAGTNGAETNGAAGTYGRATPGRSAPTGATGESDSGDEAVQRVSRVEYLNYEVLDDYGWDVGDADLFAKAADADLDGVDHGQFDVHPRESVLEAAEREGHAWPFACRGGACANCAVFMAEGDMTTRVDNILPEELEDEGIRLSCNGIPTTDEVKIVYNVKHMPDLEDLLLPPRPFEQAHGD
ncbi:MAG: ferredoxin Fer [Haloarculaceae archaeon]